MFQTTDLGTHEARVTVTDDDGASGADTVIIEYEDKTPPVISGASATPDILWPPNGKMVSVEVGVSVSDACDSAPECSIILIESNEPEGKKPDSEITDDLTADLRAERLGGGYRPDLHHYRRMCGCSWEHHNWNNSCHRSARRKVGLMIGGTLRISALLRATAEQRISTP